MEHITRRDFAASLAALPFLAVASDASASSRVDGLIRQARVQCPAPDQVAGRVDVISRALLGVRYRANTLIGGPDQAERFVVRDDAFDCVTFCEFVLAAAIAHDRGGFETALRRIRYHDGNVTWFHRNHYFAEWCSRNVENRICRRVVIEPSVPISKTLTWHRALGQRPVTIAGIAPATLLTKRPMLAAGDIIGFVSRRSNLDYFHTGFVAFDGAGAVRLRHASQSRGRVLEDRMEVFLAASRVAYVTLLRPAAEAPASKA
jgi:hypothetical protein